MDWFGFMKKSRHGFWGSLVRTNTGVSSLNFFVIGITLIAIALLALVIFAIVWEVIHNNSVASDLNGWAAFVGAVSTLVASAGISKSWSNWSENKFRGTNEESGEEAGEEIIEDNNDIPDEDAILFKKSLEEPVKKPRKKATTGRKTYKKKQRLES